MTDKKDNRPVHGSTKKPMSEKSLANLRPYVKGDPRATVHQKMGVERMKEIRERKRIVHELVVDFKEMWLDDKKEDKTIPLPDSYTFLKALQRKYFSEGNIEEATNIARELLPYEIPRQSAVTSKHEYSIDGATPEELQALLDGSLTFDELSIKISNRKTGVEEG